MTTLRDYILDCRCPNCGCSMQQQKPKKRKWFSYLAPWFVTFAIVMSVIDSLHGRWSEASYDLILAVFLVVTDR